MADSLQGSVTGNAHVKSQREDEREGGREGRSPTYQEHIQGSIITRPSPVL